MLSDQAGPSSDSALCKPDFEIQIKNTKNELERTKTLIHAFLNYLNGMKARNKVAEFIGELVTEEKYLEIRIENFLKRQEKEW